jgi:ABC-type multidrug transport system ATPase subunit
MSVLSDLCIKFQFTVVLTIHQPRKQIIDLLDSIVLLAAGKLVYSGPTRLISETFEAAGHPLPPQDESIGTTMLAAVSKPDAAAAIAEYFKNSPLAQPDAQQPTGKLFGAQEEEGRLYKRSLLAEIVTVCKRTTVVQRRNQNATGM